MSRLNRAIQIRHFTVRCSQGYERTIKPKFPIKGVNFLQVDIRSAILPDGLGRPEKTSLPICIQISTMNHPKSNRNQGKPPIVTTPMLDEEDPKQGIGWIVAVGFGVICFLFVLMIIAQSIRDSMFEPELEAERRRDFEKNGGNAERFLPSDQPQKNVFATRDFKSLKAALLQTTPVQNHPEYDRIVKFIDNIKSVLNDEVNPELRSLIDYDLLAEEIIRQSDAMSKYDDLETKLPTKSIGPTSFHSYEVIHIESGGDNKYVVYLEYSTGYGGTEPHIWWLSDNGEIKVYDWAQVEFGLRDSTESAIVYDSSILEKMGYNDYAKLCNEYIDSGSETESVSEQNKKIERILTECEEFSGPPELRSYVYLVTARRWKYENDDRALTLLKKINNPDRVPGAYRSAGDIQFERGQHIDAIESYRKYVQLLGPTSHAQQRLAACYRELGELELEREALSELTRTINANKLQSVAQLIELNSEVQNKELFAKLDESPMRDPSYSFLVDHFADYPFYEEKFDLINEHLQNKWPESGAAKIASLKLNSDNSNAKAILKWIDENCEEDPNDLRYTFWYELDDSQIVEVFKSSEKPVKNFETIWEINEYEGLFSNEAMLAICEFVLETEKKNFKALFQRGLIKLQQENYKEASECLQESLEAMPESFEGETYLRSELLYAHYKSGNRSAASALAKDAELVARLLAVKSNEDDFDRFEELLKQLDQESSDYEYYSAIWQQQQGNSDAAIKTLVKLLNSKDKEDSYDVRIYPSIDKLIEMCQEQGDILTAFTLAPTDRVFHAVSRRLVDECDWTNCERLLQSEALKEKQLLHAQLRQRVNWEQGHYAEVVDQADAILGLAKSEFLSNELDRLVRAALRIGKVDRAREFARSAAKLADQQYLVVLVALYTQDAKRVGSLIKDLPQYQLERVYTDPDLAQIDWRKSFPASKLPPRNASYLQSGERQFHLEMLFDKPQTIDQQMLETIFASELSPELHIERLVRPEEPREIWVVESKFSRIFISQVSIDGVATAKQCEINSLQDSIRNSTSLLRVNGYANTLTTTQTNYESMLAVVRSIANESLQAVANYSSWLTSADLAAFQEQASKHPEAGSPQLFRSGEFNGEFFYFPVDSEPALEDRNREFFKALVAAIKQYEASPDADKSLSIQFSVWDASRERITAKFNKVNRNGYRNTQVLATILNEPKYNPSIKKGDEVILYMDIIDGFELQTSGQTTKQDRFQK